MVRKNDLIHPAGVRGARLAKIKVGLATVARSKVQRSPYPSAQARLSDRIRDYRRSAVRAHIACALFAVFSVVCVVGAIAYLARSAPSEMNVVVNDTPLPGPNGMFHWGGH